MSDRSKTSSPYAGGRRPKGWRGTQFPRGTHHHFDEPPKPRPPAGSREEIEAKLAAAAEALFLPQSLWGFGGHGIES